MHRSSKSKFKDKFTTKKLLNKHKNYTIVVDKYLNFKICVFFLVVIYNNFYCSKKR